MKAPLKAQLQLQCRGVVQGVGFRPWVQRLATALGLHGWLQNVAGAVAIELNGERQNLELFLQRLSSELPAPARLESLEPQWGPFQAQPPGVVIRSSPAAGVPLGVGLVAPALVADLAPCGSCLAELHDPANRRYGYPFISCSSCGPRYSIATAEAYGRAHTSLDAFPLCPACRQEFADPNNRRFQAETIGCPSCGPQLQFWEETKEHQGEPIEQALRLLQGGGILALQGVGGFQLLVDAGDPKAVDRLRQRKGRPAKPFALLAAEPAWLASSCWLNLAEEKQLRSSAAPIVLLRRRSAPGEAFAGVAPGSAYLGLMLPASPLHQLLVERFGRPLVATSGNPSGEPLCSEPTEARQRLSEIADGFLYHNRPIARPLDDSVLHLIDGRPALLRRARGYAPEALAIAPGAGVLALGGDLKCAPALALGTRLWLAPQLGDLAVPSTDQRLTRGIEELIERHGPQLATLACDSHPGYRSQQLAAALALPLQQVPHHLAHALAVMLEHGLAAPALAVACDGLGYGEAGGLWGGEIFQIGAEGHRRLACCRPFPLPGGPAAQREPRRAALGLLSAAGPQALQHPGAWRSLAAFNAEELPLLLQSLASGCNSPPSSSLGRLFDAVASLLGLVQQLSYEGEGGLLLEGAASREKPAAPNPAEPPSQAYPWPLRPQGELSWLDWQPLLTALLNDCAAKVSIEQCAGRFQRGLGQGLASACQQLAQQQGCQRVLLSGGCFQNRLLLEETIIGLRQRGLEPFWPEAVPCNDGGLGLGQVAAARRALSITKTEPIPPRS